MGIGNGFVLTIRLGFGPKTRVLVMQQGRSMPRYDYEVERAAQIIAYFALRTKERSLNILKAMKLVYLADRESVRRCGEPLLNEPRFALPRGPVNHMTYQLASGRGGQPSEWARFLLPRGDGNELFVRGNVVFGTLDELSAADVECLDAVWRQFGWMDEHVLCAWTHRPENVPEWTNPDGGRKPISLAAMMGAVGIPDARRRADEIEYRGSVRQAIEMRR